jgi:hypothetical protein
MGSITLLVAMALVGVSLAASSTPAKGKAPTFVAMPTSPQAAITPALVKAFGANLQGWHTQQVCRLTGQGPTSAGYQVTCAYHTVLQAYGPAAPAQAIVGHLLAHTAGTLTKVLAKPTAYAAAAAFWAPGGTRAIAHGYTQALLGNGLQRVTVTVKGKPVATVHPTLRGHVTGPVYNPANHPAVTPALAAQAPTFAKLASNLNAPVGAARGSGKATYGPVAKVS